jgi:DNA polymerase-1
MTVIKLFPEIEERIAKIPERKPYTLPIRPNTAHLSERIQCIEEVEDGEALLTQFNRLQIATIAIDTEFRFGSESVDLGRRRSWQDPTTLQPLLLSGVAWLPDSNTEIGFVFDLRGRELVQIIDRLLRLPAMFVAHYFSAEFKTLWALGLDPVLPQMYDTWVAARALTLGTGHRYIDLLAEAHENEDWALEEQAPEMQVGHLSLLGQCAIYGVEHPFALAKDLLQRSFLAHGPDEPFSEKQIEYAAADAIATLRLYLAQQRDVIAAGLYPDLIQVEFPYAEAGARMEYDGVPVSSGKVFQLRGGLQRAVHLHRAALIDAGLANPNSNPQALAFLQARGHGDRLMRNGRPTTKDEVLQQIEARDTIVTHLRRYRRYARMLADPLFDGRLIGSDGRLHPERRQLGAGTGRASCAAPNITGITKTFRPIVEAPPGRAIIELDYAQIEVGICAAEHDDKALIAAFNSGDLYAAVAQHFYHVILSEEERALSPEEFKARRPDLRDRIKTFVLAVLYNMQAEAIADRFGISLAEAEQQRQEFLDSYPTIKAAMARLVEDGRIRGCAVTIGGLRRYIPATHKAVNQLINTPVQAGAGVVFREGVGRLYQHFRGTGTKLILPVHDAVVIECDLDKVEAVGEEASQIMIDAVRKYYPVLWPRVEINATAPHCWNKDGHADSLDHFLDDPSYKLQ